MKLAEVHRKGLSKRQAGALPQGFEDAEKMIKSETNEKNDLFKKNVELTNKLEALQIVLEKT